MRFSDRVEAGEKLADILMKYKDEDPVVLALPRGGVPVGFEVAKALEAPLDVVLVRKIGVPWQPELALGALVEGNPPTVVLNDDVVAQTGVGRDFITAEAARQEVEIERRRKAYVGDRALVSVEGKTAIIVDDGIATGATMRAVIDAVKMGKPKRTVLAVPVGPPGPTDALRGKADEVICLYSPESFGAVGLYYEDFTQTTDDEVIELLHQAPTPH